MWVRFGGKCGGVLILKSSEILALNLIFFLVEIVWTVQLFTVVLSFLLECFRVGKGAYLTFRWDLRVFKPMPIFAMGENLLPADDIGAAVLMQDPEAMLERGIPSEAIREIRLVESLCVFVRVCTWLSISFVSGLLPSHCKLHFCVFFYFPIFFSLSSMWECTLSFDTGTFPGLWVCFSNNQHFYITLELFHRGFSCVYKKTCKLFLRLS